MAADLNGTAPDPQHGTATLLAVNWLIVANCTFLVALLPHLTCIA
jgi:hypothetical protein